MMPLHVAAIMNPSIEVIGLLLERGADVNAKSNDSMTPLICARGYNNNKAVASFIEEVSYFVGRVFLRVEVVVAITVLSHLTYFKNTNQQFLTFVA